MLLDTWPINFSVLVLPSFAWTSRREILRLPPRLVCEISEKLEVTKVYRLPTTVDEHAHNEQRPFNTRRVHRESLSEYHPDLRPSPRTSTKPYQVCQPEGPSFQVKRQRFEWEKWSFRVGFNYREGLTLHNICYDSRNLFYRLFLAELIVPYGEPRAPYPRKAAFDLGNDGAGINANNLSLECDCLGSLSQFAKAFNSYTKTDTACRYDHVL